VKLKRGTWEVEIAAREDQVKQAISDVLDAMKVAEPEESTASMVRDKTVRASTCRSLALALYSEGWFVSERTLGEVHEELARKGYHYDRTAVSHALTDLVRESVLTRSGVIRNYRYVQKRPSIS
jgi:hypothetical protein|tara:strand:- start:188 stop:559 length:372 start_codon:yes stop_codon:yes gene_type:complete